MLPPQCFMLNSQCLYVTACQPEAKRQVHVPGLDIKVLVGMGWFSPLLVQPQRPALSANQVACNK